MKKQINIYQSSEISSLTQSKPEQSYEKYDQQFDSYQQTKKLDSVSASYKDDFQSESHLSSFAKMKNHVARNTQENYYGDSIGQSVPKSQFQQSRVIKGVRPLQTIKEETKNKHKPSTQQRTSQKTEVKQKHSEKQKQKQKVRQRPMVNQKTKLKITMHSDQKHLPYNFNRLKEMEKQRVLTDLMEENGHHKQSIRYLEEELKKQKIKYAKLLQEKVSQGDDSREKALGKENQALKMRIESLLQFKKTHDQNNTFKALSIPQQKPSSLEQDKIKQQLISVIDKLKKRLKESEQQLKVLQRKLEFSQELDIQQSLSSKSRQLEKLEYKFAQLTEQAQTDRLFIDQLKQKCQRTEEFLKEQRDKHSKLRKQFRGIQLKIATNNDLVKELAETRKQRDALEKSLRQLSASLITKVESKNKQQRKQLDALGYIEVIDFGH